MGKQSRWGDGVLMGLDAGGAPGIQIWDGVTRRWEVVGGKLDSGIVDVLSLEEGNASYVSVGRA